MKLCKGAILALAVSYGLTYCHTTKSKLTLEQKSDSLTVIHITNPTNYILLPIEEEAAESQVLLDTGEATDTDMDIRLAQTQVDYFVPFALPTGVKTATVCVRNKSKDALCWKEIKLSDTFWGILHNGGNPDAATPRGGRRSSDCKLLLLRKIMTVLNKEVTANYVPAAAVKRRSQALSGITGCKGSAGGRTSWK